MASNLEHQSEQHQTANHNDAKGQMMQQLLQDNSHAFLSDIKAPMTMTKLEAEAGWWKGLSKETNSPDKLNSADDLKKMQSNGWVKDNNPYYNELTKSSADGKLKDTVMYDKKDGNKLNETFLRFDQNNPLEEKQQISMGFRTADQKSSLIDLSIRESDYSSGFHATFNSNGSFKNAEEYGNGKNPVYYSFRADGSLEESQTHDMNTSKTIDHQYFNNKSEPVSDASSTWDATVGKILRWL